MNNITDKLIVGWREWASLPNLNAPMIKVKMDTGAATSALHAFDIEHVRIDKQDYVKFNIHPIQRNDDIVRACMAEVLDIRNVRSSNGKSEKRFVIRTVISIGDKSWPINVTLTNRDIMKHRMLLGREAMKHILIDPIRQFHQGVVTNKAAKKFYCDIVN